MVRKHDIVDDWVEVDTTTDDQPHKLSAAGRAKLNAFGETLFHRWQKLLDMTQAERTRAELHFMLTMLHLPEAEVEGISNTKARAAIARECRNVYDVLWLLRKKQAGDEQAQVPTFDSKKELLRYTIKSNKKISKKLAKRFGLGCLLCKFNY
jgi:hypothetical protein